MLSQNGSTVFLLPAKEQWWPIINIMLLMLQMQQSSETIFIENLLSNIDNFFFKTQSFSLTWIMKQL